VPDTVLDRIVLPFTERVGRLCTWFRWVQRGSVHVYLLYILVALVLSLLWWR
jgi:hypothetical protein